MTCRSKLTTRLAFTCSWSPAGRIAFTNGENIFTIRANGTGLSRLTRATAKELAPLWSPDGTSIAFLRQQPGGNRAPYDLWTMAADGSRQVRVATTVLRAGWSPDGALIAFIRGFPGTRTTFEKPKGLWLMQRDGSGQLQIAKGASQFDWQALH